MKKYIFLILLIIGLSGCSGEEGNSNKMTIAIQSYINTLEPTEQYDSWGIVKFGVGETLTRFDEDGKVQPWLATDYEVSSDKLSWTFTIRDDVYFSNGDQLTPEIVVNSLIRSFELNNRASSFFEYESIVAKGEDVVITTTEPYAQVAGNLADPLFLIINTEVDLTNIATEGPICTGPYVFTSFEPTVELTLDANENYWNGNVGFEQVIIKFIEDQATRSMALQSEEVDLAYNLKQENMSNFENDDEYQIQSLDSLRTTFAFMNQNGVHGDINLRQVIIKSLDRSTYNESLLEGGATTGKAPVPPTLDFGFNQLNDENSYDPEAAIQQLADNGYVDIDGDGLVENPDGSKLQLSFVLYTSREELSVYAQAA